MIDLRMGRDELHGWEIAQKVRADRTLNDLPVLVCSADVEALKAIAADLAAMPRVATLAKPFRIDDLTAVIDRLLAETSRR